jgi:dimethylamine---corrinoid protein Co-methyltransferase
MALAHMHASGMGGIRTAGDLVARMQLSKKMRLNEAKEYVAGKLKVSVEDLVDEVVMNEVRQDLDISTVYAGMGEMSRGIESKFRIAKLLDLEINSVQRFLRKTNWQY